MNGPRRPRRRAVPALLLAALAAWSAGCGSERSAERDPQAGLPIHDTGVKVLLVGLDGATFSVIDPLLAAGELPVLAGLVEHGARGPLRSEKPMRSPALWTTMATGRPREQHGIDRFTFDDPAGAGKVLVNSTMRKSLAVWEILGAAGRSVGVAGWWATWPAEPVRGWLVSDRITRSRWSEWADGAKSERLTYPPGLAAELLPLVVDPRQPPLDELRAIVPFTPQEEAELLAAEKPIWAHGPSVLKFAYCTQRSYEKMALHLLARGQPDFTTLFLIAQDPVSHTFWHYHEPQAYDFGDQPRLPHRAAAVANMYRHNDRYMAELLAAVSEDTVVLVVSDHGFRASGKMPERKPLETFAGSFASGFADTENRDGSVTVGQSGVHHLDGVLVAAGGPVRPGVRLEATLYDIAPTVLALLGLPVPEDLPGRVLEEMLEPGFLARFPVGRVPTYEGLVERLPAAAAATESGQDAETLEMLRSLGYIQ